MRIGKITIMDDVLSIVHVIVAILSVLLNISIPATLIFIAYQFYEKERWIEKRGDFVEWLIGLMIGGGIDKIII